MKNFKFMLGLSGIIFVGSIHSDFEQTELNQNLLKAAGVGDFQKVQDLISRGADVNYTNSLGETPLLAVASDTNLAAISQGKRGPQELFNVAQLLIDKGAQLDAEDKSGLNPLLAASSGGYKQVAQLLIDRGAKVNFENAQGRTPLMAASSSGHKEIAKALIDKNANVNARTKDDFGGKTALMEAAFYGHPEVVDLLIGSKADYAIKNYKGKTALDLAKEGKNATVYDLSGKAPEDKNARSKRYQEVINILNKIQSGSSGWDIFSYFRSSN